MIVKPFYCVVCDEQFATKGELNYHKCGEVAKKEAKPVVLDNPIVIEADKEAVEEKEIAEKEIAEATEKIEQDKIDKETKAIQEKLDLMSMSVEEIKVFGTEHGIDRRKLNNKSKESMVDIILENKKA